MSDVESRNTRTQLKRRIAILQQVCTEAYQLAGAVGAPEKALDNLSAAANGKPIPHATFLPVSAADCNELTDAEATRANKRGSGSSIRS